MTMWLWGKDGSWRLRSGHYSLLSARSLPVVRVKAWPGFFFSLLKGGDSSQCSLDSNSNCKLEPLRAISSVCMEKTCIYLTGVDSSRSSKPYSALNSKLCSSDIISTAWKLLALV